METLALKKITFVETANIYPIPELSVTGRLVEHLYSKNKESLILEILSGSCVLKNASKFYAYENYVLVKCMSQLFPELELNFNVESMRNKEALYEKINTRNFVDSLSKYEIRTLLSIQERLKDEFGLKPFVRKRDLSIITGKHRSTIYKYRPVKSIKSEVLKLDLDSALSNIPERRNSK